MFLLIGSYPVLFGKKKTYNYEKLAMNVLTNSLVGTLELQPENSPLHVT